MDRYTTSIWEAVLAFRPSMQYSLEKYYTLELSSYLGSRFPSTISEKKKGGSCRPDISIGSVIIEVKGPSGKSQVKALLYKGVKYTSYYSFLFFVLFDVKGEITPAFFKDIKAGLVSKYSEVGVIAKR
jgi:hypothetical protein